MYQPSVQALKFPFTLEALKQVVSVSALDTRAENLLKTKCWVTGKAPVEG